MPLFGHSDKDIRSAYRRGRAVGRLEATLEQSKINLNAGDEYTAWIDNFGKCVVENLVSGGLIGNIEHARDSAKLAVTIALIKYPAPG
jgi:hypothetical protein